MTPRIKAVTIAYAQGMFDYDFLDGSARAALVFNDGTTETGNRKLTPTTYKCWNRVG